MTYLRNIVHLPFYLQNSGLRKVAVAQQVAGNSHKSKSMSWVEFDREDRRRLSIRGEQNRVMESETTVSAAIAGGAGLKKSRNRRGIPILYTVYQENRYFVKNMLLLKNPQFLPNHYEIL